MLHVTEANLANNTQSVTLGKCRASLAFHSGLSTFMTKAIVIDVELCLTFP